jgi:pimeloyl-ACP methyl ester carboxylesterase
MVGPVKTHYVTKGESGRPIVFIHGFGSCTYSWRLNMDDAAQKCRAYALDLKGFGLTAKPKDRQYHLAAFTDHLREFLNVLKLEKPILVGNSMGGTVAVRLALMYPDRVGGLVLVDPAPLTLHKTLQRLGQRMVVEQFHANPSQETLLRPELRALLIRTLITRRTVESSLRAALLDHSRITPEMVEVYYRPLTIEGAAEALVSVFDPPADPQAEIMPPLETLKLPVLIIWGKHDRVLPLEQADDYVKAIPQARFLVFEKSAHLPHEEEPAAFNAALLQFADQVR